MFAVTFWWAVVPEGQGASLEMGSSVTIHPPPPAAPGRPVVEFTWEVSHELILQGNGQVEGMLLDPGGGWGEKGLKRNRISAVNLIPGSESRRSSRD